MRIHIHKDVWSMSWLQKEVLVKSLVHKCDVKRHRVDQSEPNRKNTLKYSLNNGSGLIPVCKKMFLSTTGLTQHYIRTKVCDSPSSPSHEKEPKSSSSRSAIKEFLASLPSVPSHYCRKSSTKKYLESSFNSKADIFRLYKDWCRKKKIGFASRQVFINEFDEGNFAIFRTRKDQCDLCGAHDEGNVDEATYAVHRLRKEMAQRAKDEDKKRAAESNVRLKMITMDLQAVLLAPALKASALYYRTKLCVHNFTIFDCTTRYVSCYVWHEAEGGLTCATIWKVISPLKSLSSFQTDVLTKIGTQHWPRH
ncbi:hypothetical protein PoB_000098600 [Plakobranchus ocellatus]|uniref:Uncharacterized protein n=1 Tax=Plakobranchus ocellatus TaxID=259542 RepID=A0AAV3WWP5_9GAST|nr:hypothetical protein PoB_000098600 [Plakobranchus ocellatus]